VTNHINILKRKIGKQFLNCLLIFFIFYSFLISAASQTDNANFEVDKLLMFADEVKTTNIAELITTLDKIKANINLLDNNQQAYLNYLKAYEFIAEGDLEKAIKHLLVADDYAEDPDLNLRINMSLVNMYALKKDWKSGLEHLRYLSKNYLKSDDEQQIVKTLMVAIIFYNEVEEFSLSEKFINRLLSFDIADKRYDCVANISKIRVDNELKKYTELEKRAISTIEFCKSINEPYLAALAQSYLAKHYFDTSRKKNAIVLLESMINDVNTINHPLLTVEVKELMSTIYLSLGNYKNAEQYAVDIIENTQAKDYLKPQLSAYQTLYNIAKLDNNSELALQYLEKQFEFNQLLNKEINAKQMAIETSKHLSIEKDNQIALLNKEKEITQLELETQKQRLFFWIVVLIAAAVITVLWFYRRNAQKELRRQKQINWELQELDKLKDRILTNTSHELRTPLNGIIGLSEILVADYEDKVEDALIKSIRLIGKSGVHLSYIINDILDLAQLKSKRISVKLEEFDLYQTIIESVTICQPLIKSPNVKLNFTTPPSEIMIKQDQKRVKQVLFNLIGNAVKFTNEGQVLVSVETQDEHIWVTVSDTGIGIPKDKQDRVFEGFEQVDSSNSRRHQGSGIGLAITKEIVQLLGGEIQLESEDEQGTCIKFSLPRQPIDD
jgi:signal transduction histidine kinase